MRATFGMDLAGENSKRTEPLQSTFISGTKVLAVSGSMGSLKSPLWALLETLDLPLEHPTFHIPANCGSLSL
jgi:hypothetical protein